MHQDRSDAPQGPIDDASERAIIDTLLDHPAPFALKELYREFKAPPVLVEDAINALVGAGLVHRIGEDFVVMSRAATRAAEVYDG